MLCDFAIKYYLTTEVCAIEIMSPTCVSDSTIMLSIPRVQTSMSIVVNWPWGLKFSFQLLQLEFSKCRKLVAPVGNKFQSRHNLVIKYKNSKSIVSDWLTLDCNLLGGNVKSQTPRIQWHHNLSLDFAYEIIELLTVQIQTHQLGLEVQLLT